jgi:hypothetical protein
MRHWVVVDAVDPPGREGIKSLQAVLTDLQYEGWTVFQILTTTWMYKVVAWRGVI